MGQWRSTPATALVECASKPAETWNLGDAEVTPATSPAGALAMSLRTRPTNEPITICEMAAEVTSNSARLIDNQICQGAFGVFDLLEGQMSVPSTNGSVLSVGGLVGECQESFQIPLLKQ